MPSSNVVEYIPMDEEGYFLPYIKFNNAIQRKRYWLGEDGIYLQT